MPTPVSLARQCLTDEAARALNDAVAVARRRSHSQTTSLHAVSALLTLPASTLRDACARARSSAYSPRLQFRALELCVSVSLDRLPVSKTKTLDDDDEPPVSNSLMAAIKRSQANQRRHPETFHLYQMHQQLHGSQSSLSCIKVELKHLILSILDDPIVSRVFGDAGFRSTDVKIAVMHPQTSLKFPPVFLCNVPDRNINHRINFPFAVDNGEEDFKRIGRVLVQKSLKNPLLIGGLADTVVTGFVEAIKIGKVGILPEEIEGLDVVSISKEIGLGNLSEDVMSLKVKEVREKVEGCGSGKHGVIVNFGELKVFLDGVLLEYVVKELGELVRVYGGKLWLIGSVGSYEVYMKVLAKFPGLDKDWDLNLLPITSSGLNPIGSQLKSSLMGSFVPFGGLLPELQSIANSSSSKLDQSATRCDVCNEKYEQEVSVVLKGGKSISLSDQQSTGLASWMQGPESDSTNALDHSGVFNARIIGLQRKWSEICNRLHHNLRPQQDGSQIRARIPFHHGFQPDPERTETNGQDSNRESGCRNLSPPTVSITTDLGLGNIHVSPDPDPGPRAHETRLQIFNGLGPVEIDETCKHALNEKDFKQFYTALADKVGYQSDTIRAISQTITRVRTGAGRRYVWFMFSGSDLVGKKKVTRALAEVVFGSPKSLISIDLNFENQMSHPGSVFNHQNVNFSDPSFRGKTITEFIAEELTKKPQSVVLLEHIDRADFVTKDTISQAIKTGRLSDARGRETRITDAIFVLTTSNNKEESGKEFMSYSEERILNAQALQMRLSVEKTESRNSTLLLLPKDSVFRNPDMSKKRKIIEIGGFEIMVPQVKKIKSCFDLNLPLNDTEESENDTVSETKEVWFEELSDQVDEKVVFDPFDFDSRAESILKEISKWFEKSFGRNVGLEIENEVMVQILASDWASDENGGVENWIKTVLYRGFMDAKQKESVGNEYVVKLVVVEGAKIEEDDAFCVCLPSNIMVK